ncbi:MAG: hypothetical protein JXD19_04345 [Deltaproteobacteria bacterium]|nr:hypothetical protein [Deltaproteobacteria bacterium]
MIKNYRALEQFERDFVRNHTLSHTQAMKLVAGMWREGVTLGVLPPRDPLEGIEVDIRISKVLNACLKNFFHK